ncbi:DUF6221 family protein [Streptomyces globisporus]|uniref:DUF6221 family protein n=1 Tax=Streptomyces globisporus TaxID=1908 RepID=UPI0038307C5F
MTAQGEDILAWLERAIATREKTALSADQGTWTATHEGYEEWDASVGTSTGGAVANCNIEDADHIALNDPESVLRRCTADRKLIAEHGPCSDQDLGCKGCGFNNQEESMVDHYEECPVLCALAEGYGWTEGER